MRDLKIVYQEIGSIKLYPNNPRTHSKQQIKKLARGIKHYGFINPIIVDEKNMIIVGYGRYEAAIRLGLESVPTIRIEDMSEADIRAYRIADNRLAELAGWDPDILGREFLFLSNPELEFDVEITGFDQGSIDIAIEGLNGGGGSKSDVVDRIPPIDKTKPPISKRGDLFKLGHHRLFVGDATKPASYKSLMCGTTAQMAFNDSPFNVPVAGHVSGLGKTKHREFVMASGEMSPEAFHAFLKCVFINVAAYCQDGSIHFVFMDWRHIGEILAAGKAAYTELKNLIVWNKTNAGMGAFYRSKHELIFVFKKGTAPHINNFELGQNGRYRTNVWDYPGLNSFAAGRMDDLAMHPTVKPVALVADAIKDCSKRNGIILDCFAGSGTTIIAAEQTGRRAHVMEIDPLYVDTAIRRWQAITGERAIHAASGKSFDELSKSAGDGQ
jgi:DNA modification methylase